MGSCWASKNIHGIRERILDGFSSSVDVKSFMSLLAHSLSESFLSSCCVPGTELGAGNTKWIGTRICPQGIVAANATCGKSYDEYLNLAPNPVGWLFQLCIPTVTGLHLIFSLLIPPILKSSFLKNLISGSLLFLNRFKP